MTKHDVEQGADEVLRVLDRHQFCGIDMSPDVTIHFLESIIEGLRDRTRALRAEKTKRAAKAARRKS